MIPIYLDTNIYIYLSQKDSPFYEVCSVFIKQCKNRSLTLATSVETIQEIIHYSKIYNQLSKGIKIAKNVLEISENIFTVNRQTIEKYLHAIQKYSQYKSIDSRDFIHFVTSIENSINIIITYDKGFKKFPEIDSMTPAEFLKLKT